MYCSSDAGWHAIYFPYDHQRIKSITCEVFDSRGPVIDTVEEPKGGRGDIGAISVSAHSYLIISAINVVDLRSKTCQSSI